MTTSTALLPLLCLCIALAACNKPEPAADRDAGAAAVDSAHPATPADERDGATRKPAADAQATGDIGLAPAATEATDATAATPGSGGPAHERECRDETRPPEPGDEDLPPCAPGGAPHLGPWWIRGGQNDLHVDTVVCTLAKPFDLRGTVGIVMHMSGGARGGTFTTSGQAAGVIWSGGGTYTIEATATDADSVMIEATGTSTIDSPMGRFSDAVEPAFLATPTRKACGQT